MVQTLFEKLNFKDERNVLIQGVPVAIERCFGKVGYMKHVTPLLRKNKIDFALLFSIDKTQLERILLEVLEHLSTDGRLWIVYPRPGSKIFSNLNSHSAWSFLRDQDYHLVRTVEVESVYNAVLYARNAGKSTPLLDFQDEQEFAEEDMPEDLHYLFEQFPDAAYYFYTLSVVYQKQFVHWIELAEDSEVRLLRIRSVVERLLEGNYALSDLDVLGFHE